MDNILFGAAYYDEYMPCDRIDKDFSLMKQAGMNVIRIAESTWSTWEKKDGQFDFSKLHRMLQKAEEYGLSVIVGTPTYAIPPWLFKKHPEIMAVTKSGPELYGHRQLFDLTNKDYRFHCERIIRRMMEEIKDYGCIIGFQLDNECHHANAANESAQRKFRATLAEEFPDINEFNKEFGLEYWSNAAWDWDDFPDVRGTINQSIDAKYQAFLREQVTDFMAWQAAIVNEYRREGQFLTHNFDFDWKGYGFGIQPQTNQQDAARALDIAGVDIYHLSQENLDGAMISFGGSVARSLKKDNYLVLETQAQGNIEWLPFPGQARLCAYSHLASGAESVMYWNWHSIHNAIESYWMGVLSHNLEPGAIYEELSAFRKEELQIEEKIAPLKKTCDVAILADNKSLTALDEFPTDEDFTYNHILRHIHDVLYKMNIETDIVYTGDDFSSYSLLVIPALYCASEETLRKIKAYVNRGGHILMSYRSAYADPNLKIYHDRAPHLLTDVIGATYDSFTKPCAGANISIDGSRIRCDKWMELIMPKTAEVWASYEHPAWQKYAAITHNQFGAGEATYIATHLPERALAAVAKKALERAGVKVPASHFPVIEKSGTNKSGKTVTYVFNYSSDEVTYSHEGKKCVNLLGNSTINPGAQVTIKPWDLIILENE